MKIILIIFGCYVWAQQLETDISIFDVIHDEIHIINNGILNSSLWHKPFIQKSPSENISLNLFSKFDNDLIITPIFAIRYNNVGFEFDSLNINKSILWITPGLKINTTFPVISPYTGIMMHVWADFYKHSAYNLSSNSFLSETNLNLFKYHPKYSNEFYTLAEIGRNAIEFDESQGGCSIYGSNFLLALGKFKTSSGPFMRSNLAISHRIPSFPQLTFNYSSSDYWEFSFKTGELFSQEIDQNLDWIFSNSSRNSFIKRFIVNHRLDFIFTPKLRIGFYEQVIFGGRSYPLTYLNPFQLYWSAQHALGDIDNVQMGLDVDLLINNGRYNFAFLMDEWSPFSTFDIENHHNWFAMQLGFTKILSLRDKPIYFRIELAGLAPQIYTHKFNPNIAEATHYGYPIGYWSGGNSLDLWILIYFQQSENIHIRLEIDYTKISEAIYSDDINYLENNLKKRYKNQLELNYKLKNLIWIDLQIGYYLTDNIYLTDNFFHLQTQLRYNISY